MGLPRTVRDVAAGMERIRLLTARNHGSHYDDLGMMLRLHYHIHGETLFLIRAISNGMFIRNYKVDGMAEVLFHHNMQHLLTALHALECSLIHPCNDLLRTVVEAVPKMYYVALNPEEADPILNADSRKAARSKGTEKEAKICNPAVQKKAGRHDDSMNCSKKDEKYHPSYFREKLYRKSRLEKINRLYSELNISVHASFERNRTANDYDPKVSDSKFRLLKMMSFFNIAACMEGAYGLIHDLCIYEKTESAMESLHAKIKDEFDGVDFTPNKGDLPHRLRFSPGSISSPA